MTAPRLTALGASQQQQLELIERARTIVASLCTACDGTGDGLRDLIDPREGWLPCAFCDGTGIPAHLRGEIATHGMLRALIEALDVQAQQIVDADQLLDSKDLQINELHDIVTELTARLGHQRDAIARYQADVQTMRDENLATERQLTAEREKTAGLLATLNDPSLHAPRDVAAGAE